MKKLQKLKKSLTLPLAAGALAVAMVGLSAGGAQAATYKFTGASLTWTANGEVLKVNDTKSDGRYIYAMGQFAGTNDNLTPYCSTRGKSSKTCDYSVAEGRKINFIVYSVRGTDMRKLGTFTVTA
ncbi:hypothetical protein ACFVT5_11225 [Streptomyces sp. NPDC058001]|uniref:hypothetical protein n=1 Tax=Streptomyces sp. NPDC058001 TaxID=3346300 RepID=UPI0036F01EEC